MKRMSPGLLLDPCFSPLSTNSICFHVLLKDKTKENSFSLKWICELKIVIGPSLKYPDLIYYSKLHSRFWGSFNATFNRLVFSEN